MKNIYDIIQILRALELPNGEVLYNLDELSKILNAMIEKDIEMCDCIITPYYVCGKKRMELYEFELNIRLTDNPDFNRYILRKTGKNRIEDIPEEIILQQRICYCEIPKINSKLPKIRIQQYIQFLYSNEKLKQEIQKIFGDFEKEKLLFELY